MTNTALRRKQIQRIIDDEPWACTVVRRGRTPDDGETSFSFTGRVVPAGTRAVSIERTSMFLGGEAPTSRYSYAVLAPHDTSPLLARDELTATRGGVTRRLRVIEGLQYPYKVEAILDELQ